MHTLRFTFEGKPITLSGPNNWSELSPKQWLQWVRWHTELGGDSAPRFLLLQLWYGLTPAMIRRFSDEDKLRLLALLDWSESRPSRWMLPAFRTRLGRQYRGPGDGLQHLTFGEFIFAEGARSRYQQTGNRDDLVEMVAVLYSPSPLFWQKKSDGGRTLFNRLTLDSTCKTIRKLSDAILQATLINYLGCIDAMPEQFPNLFEPPKESSSDSDGTWLDVGLSLARQTAAFGSFHQLEETNLYLVLTTLDTMQKEAKKLQQEMERKR